MGGLFAGLTGCGGNTIAIGQNTTVGVLLVNALIGGPSGGLDVRASTSSAVVNLQGPLLPLVSNPGAIQPNTTGQIYYLIPGANSISVSAYATGTTTSPIVTNGSVNLPVNDFDTVAITGVIGGTGSAAPTIVRFRDNPPTTGSINIANCDVKLVNLVQGVQAITLFSGTSAVGGMTNINYATTSNYQTLTAGTDYTLSIKDNKNNTLYTFPSTTNFGSAHSYSIFVTGETTGGGPAVAAIVAQDN